MNQRAIEVKQLTKRYREVTAVNGISFDVRRGEIVGLLGPNGAGKTTTVECIEGLRTPDSGDIRLLGYDVRHEPKAIKERIGIQLQTTGLYPKLTVREVIDLFASFYPRVRPTAELIDLTNLRDKEKTRTKELSGGQKQRLSIALALVNDPDVVFLDEPTTGLDPQARRQTWEVIEQLQAQGKTVLLTTHYMEEAERLCQRVAIIDHGVIIALDEPETLVRDHFQEQAIEFDSRVHPGENDLRAIGGVTRAQMDDGHITTYTTDVPTTMAGLLDLAREHVIEFRDLTVRRATLEDVFLKLTGRKIRE